MLTPWKKSYDQPRQHIKKQRHYFANKGPSSQSYGFSSSHVWMWELGTINKAEHQIIDALNYGIGDLLRFPWTARRSNQSILKEISPEYSLEGLMLKLKCQSFHHLMRRTDSFEKTLMLSNHLILCGPLLLLPSIFPSIRVFSKKSVLCIRWPKY